MSKDDKSPVEKDDPGGDESASSAAELERLKNHNKELLTELKKIKTEWNTLKGTKDKEEEEKQKEQGKYKELLEKKDKELQEAKAKLADIQKKSSLADLAIQRGINPKFVKLFEGVEFDDGGAVVNADAVIQKFQADYSEVIQSQEPGGKDIPPVDNRKPGTQKTGGKPFTRADIARMAGTPEWEKNRSEIESQMAAGLIK